MRLLIYASPFNRTVRILMEALRTLESSTRCEHITSLPELVMRLRKPMGMPAIGILMPSGNRELSALVSYRHLLRDMRIILVLPNADVPTWQTAHLLRPRYISYGDGDLSDVIAVTSRMVRTLDGIPGKIVGLSTGQNRDHPTMH